MERETNEVAPIHFMASIADSTSAVKFSGAPDEGGRLTLEIPGTDVGVITRLLDARGKALRVTIEVDE